MDFLEVIKQARAALQSEGRITYRVLKRQFALDDESLEELKEQLIDAEEVAADKDGKMLVWTGDGPPPAPPSNGQPQTQISSQSPASYTPQHLAERIRAEQSAMESRGSVDGERKTITALFADLKGSTALIEGLDPEDARAIIDPALQVMMDAVHRYDGYVAQALGDGIFALFGAPLAHEDHPQRALYAALRMQEEMRAYSDQSRLKGGIPLQMRVGINTGEVVVRSIRKDDLHTDYVPVGHSTNLAARMEQLATPGSIVVTEYTHKLTDGFFEFKTLGAATIKGVEEPLNVYEVVGAGPLRTRFQVTVRRGLTRFVGRHSELDQMQQALEQAKAGHGQIVGVMGEPGLGKSRLFYEFKLTSPSGCLVLEAFSISHGKASPYLPLIELLKTYFEITPEDDERKRREKVTGKVLTLDRNLEEIVPYLFSLLGIEGPSSPLHQMDSQVRRQRTFAALKQLFLRESLNQPLLLLVEDLHWLDTETQGFLDALSESLASMNLLLLVNYRPEYRHGWGQKTYYTQLRLAPLGKAEAEDFLTFLLGSDVSLTALKPLILARTEGTPFFMEEVVQTLVEEGTLSGERGNYLLESVPTELHISPTVQGVLAARIDRLTPDEKELLQQLAVIGRQFPLGLVKQVVSQPDTALHRLLASLQAKEFLYEQPAFPEVEYLFKHALTQEVAYGTVLQEQRKALHERTGHALEALYADTLDDHYSALAHHFRQSENTGKAVEYLGLAGQQAVQRSATVEAVAQLTTALELLHGLPDTRERAYRELRLQVALGPCLLVTKGYAAPEVESTFVRAQELCQRLGETAELSAVMLGICFFYLLSGKYQTAYGIAEQLLHAAEDAQDVSLQVEAHAGMGESLFFRGEFTAAANHFEQGHALYDRRRYPTATYRLGHDPGVQHLSFWALVLWYLGYADQAATKSREALTLAESLSHPFSVAYALHFSMWVCQLRREGQRSKEHAEALLRLSTEYEFPLRTAAGFMWRGWAMADQGEIEAGIAQMHNGLEAFSATGTVGVKTMYLPLLTEAYLKAGQPQAGFAVLVEARAAVDGLGERYNEAELYRLQGELMLHSHGQGFQPREQQEAEGCLQQAIEIARQQAAKAPELRAATSLARLWQEQGKTTEARELLAPVYNWFTEGFDTADLQEAKTLLEELLREREG